jgi:hypothetical protein
MTNSTYASEAMPLSAQDSDRKPQGPQPPLDLSHHFSYVTIARKESSMKKFYKYFMIPGIGNLAGGESYILRYINYCNSSLSHLQLPIAGTCLEVLVRCGTSS